MMFSAGSLICVAYFSLSLAPPRSRKCGGGQGPPSFKEMWGGHVYGWPHRYNYWGGHGPPGPGGICTHGGDYPVSPLVITFCAVHTQSVHVPLLLWAEKPSVHNYSQKTRLEPTCCFKLLGQ